MLEAGFVADVGVNHGRGDVLVPEEFLHGANIIAVFQQMRSETVPEGMAAGGFGDAGGAEAALTRVLEVLLCT